MEGIGGVYSKKKCAPILLTILFSIQNRGEGYCGAVTRNSRGPVSYRHEGEVFNSFSDEEIRRLSGRYGIGNVSPFIKQPISFDSNLGEISLTYNGKILNKRSLANHLKAEGNALSLKHTDVEIIGKLISRKGIKSIVEGIKDMASRVKGVYSLGILTEEGLYAFRSPVGVEPLSVGGNEEFNAFASESCALKELGLKRNQYRSVEPGEIVWIGKEIKTIEKLLGKPALCAFEPGYWGRIDSFFDGISTKQMRERAGQILAKQDIERGFTADIVIPVRESGAGYAIGYHHGSGIPYDEGFFRNWYVTRTFLQKTKKARMKGTSMKQSVIEGAVDGKSVVVLDDSIREGTTIRDKLIPLLRWGGAKEVHARIGSPENKYRCRYSVFSKSRGKLLSAGRSLEEQRKFIGADSLEFISIEGYLEALGVSRDKVCLGCWTNEFPI